MQQRIEKSGELPSCSLTKEDLFRLHGIITEKLKPSSDSKKLDERIELTHEGITYKFEDFEIFSKSPNLPAIVNQFSIYVWGDKKKSIRISFETSWLYYSATYRIEGDEDWVLYTYEQIRRLIDEKKNRNWIFHHYLSFFSIPLGGGISLTYLITAMIKWRYGSISKELLSSVYFLTLFLLFGSMYILQKEYPYTTIYLQNVTITEHLIWKVIKYIILPLIIGIFGVFILRVLGI